LAQFGLYLSFPIGYMYYFGTNLENRFSVPGFWPTQEQGHKIPYERDEIKAEVERIQREMKDREVQRRRQTENAFDSVRAKLREEKTNEDA
jgi:protein PET100